MQQSAPPLRTDDATLPPAEPAIDRSGPGAVPDGVSNLDWHAWSVDEVFGALESSPDGLASADAAARRARSGPNELIERRTRGPLHLVWEQLSAVMVLILIGAAGLSLVLGKRLEAVAIGTIVVLFALLGFVQEHRAERAIAALRRLAVPRVRVRRRGNVVEVPAVELVPGDIVLLEAGNVVPADVRIIESASLQIQEAALTGESEPVAKVVGVLPPGAPSLGDRVNMAYSGTQVTAGRGVAVVVATGMATELGRIAALLQGVTGSATPLQARLDRVGKQLALAGVAVAGVVVSMGALAGEPISELALTAISVAVAVIPEGLPAVVTFTLALGAQRMLARNALIRRLPAVETLGSVTVICSDKTGTLTENRMRVAAIACFDGNVDLTVAAADPLPATVTLTLAAGTLCNDTEAQIDDAGTLRTIGDPTETALVAAAHATGIDVVALRDAAGRCGELPFDSVRKRMSTWHRIGDAPALEPVRALAAPNPVVVVKGAVDGMIDRCVAVWSNGAPLELADEERRWALAKNEAMAARGMRVIGVAVREAPVDDGDERYEDELTLVGLVGIIDPPRAEASAAIATCASAGIRTVMMTGDHPLTARAIATDLGIIEPGAEVISGPELDALDSSGLAAVATTTSVFARVSPEHKLRIVEALQADGEVVAVTGDGVNDAPALKQADIGVAMGITGTDVSKEASDTVLRDDNFATIVAAVEEGRVIYDNLRRFVKFAVAGNIGKILVMVAWPIPFLVAGGSIDHAVALLPLQLLWLNLMTDGLLGISLGVEPAERGVMQRAPHAPGGSIWSGGLGRQAAWTGALIGAAALAVGYVYEATGWADWQTMMFTSLAFLQLFQALATRSNTESLRSLGLTSNPVLLGVAAAVAGLQLVAIYTPVRSLLNLEPLALADLLVCIGLGVALLVVLEAEKSIRRRRKLSPSAPRPSTAGLHHPVAWLRWFLATTKRVAVLLAGTALLGAGLAMLVLPGPGLLVSILGLAVLATEFAWAERMLDRTRSRAVDAANALTRTRTSQAVAIVTAIALLTGGAAVAALVEGYRLVGLSVFIAGVGSLVVVVPWTQRWIGVPAAAPGQSQLINRTSSTKGDSR